jgi:hypothetical protein
VEDFLTGLARSGIRITDPIAVERLPAEAFGGAYRPGHAFVTNASEALRKLSTIETDLLRSHLEAGARTLVNYPDLLERFSSVIL